MLGRLPDDVFETAHPGDDHDWRGWFRNIIAQAILRPAVTCDELARVGDASLDRLIRGIVEVNPLLKRALVQVGA
jgi:hypothetical protein